MSCSTLFQRILLGTSLRTILIVPFVVQILGAVGLVGYFSFLNGQKAVNDLASQLRNELTQRIERELESYLSSPPIINQLNATALAQGKLDITQSQNLNQFVQQGKLFPFSYGIYCANQNGDHVSVGHKSFSDRSFSAWILDRSVDRYFYSYDLDSQGNRINSTRRLEKEYGLYDPRTRPWYQAAVQYKQPVWSEVYVDFDLKTRLLMITAAQPVYASNSQTLIGVCGTDVLLLQEFRRFLRNLSIGKTGKAFVIDRSGQIISSSSEEAISTGSDTDPKLVQAIQSQDPRIRATATALQQQFGNFGQIRQSVQFDFELNGDRQFAQVLPYQNRQGLDWLIVVVVPESDFMAQINANTRSTLLLCFLALITAVLTGIVTARWVAKPILELNHAAKRMTSGDSSRTVQAEGAKEVGELARSFNDMSARLHDSFTTLKTKNEELRFAEENYRSIFENALEGIFQVSPEGKILRVNRAYALLFGYPSPQDMSEAMPELFQQIFVDVGQRETLRQLLSQQSEVRDFEFQAYRRDGSQIWVATWVRAVNDVQNNLLYYEGSCIDITANKQQEAALKQQLQELQFEIDHHQRMRQVTQIEATDYFQQLLADADNLRYSDDA